MTHRLVLPALGAFACSAAGPTKLPAVDCTASPGHTVCTEAYARRSVPEDRGWTWQEDPSFLLTDHTVPSFIPLPGGGHLLVSTHRLRRGTLGLHRSLDGKTWQAHGTLPTHLLPASCGTMFLDATGSLLKDGTVRVLVEGWQSPTGQARPDAKGPPSPGDDPGIRLCALRTDGTTWTVEGTGPLLPTDGSIWPSVPALYVDPATETTSLFFADTYPGRDAVRRATSPDGVRFVPDTTPTVLPERHVDPDPISVRGTTRIRLYHTLDALSGELGVSTSDDGGQSFRRADKLTGLSGQVCHTPPEQPSGPDLCYFDPAFLVAADGTLQLYYTRFQTTADGRDVVGIGRALATD
jgi:hypothetical protein